MPLSNRRVIKAPGDDGTAFLVRGAEIQAYSVGEPEPDSLLDVKLSEMEELRNAMLEEAAAEAAAMREQARAEGYRIGVAQAEAETGEALRQLQQLAANALADSAQWARDTEQELVQLVLLVAQRVIQHELAVHPDLVVDAVRRGLETVTDSRSARIRVHPDDAAIVLEHWAEATGGAPLDAEAVTPDVRVQRGGCIVETGKGRIDAQPSTILATIERAFGEHFGEWA